MKHHNGYTWFFTLVIKVAFSHFRNLRIGYFEIFSNCMFIQFSWCRYLSHIISQYRTTSRTGSTAFTIRLSSIKTSTKYITGTNSLRPSRSLRCILWSWYTFNCFLPCQLFQFLFIIVSVLMAEFMSLFYLF